MVFKISEKSDMFTELHSLIRGGDLDLFQENPESESKSIVFFAAKRGNLDTGCNFKAANKMFATESLGAFRKELRNYFQGK